MSYIFLIFALLILLIVCYLIFDKNLTSPSFISVAMFLFCALLSLIGLKYWNTENELNNRIIIIIMSGMVAFVLGELFLKFVFKKKYKDKEENYKFKEIKVNSVIYFLTILFVLTTIVLLILEIKRICNFYGFSSKSIPQMLAFYRTKIGLFSTDLAKDGVDIKFIIKQMKKTCDVICVIWMYIFLNNIKSKSSKKTLLLNFIPIGITMISTLLTSGRSLLMHMLVSFVMMFLLIFYLSNNDNKKNFKTFRNLLITGVCIIVIFYLILPLTGRKTNSNIVDYISFYMGTTIPSFNVTIDKLPQNDYVGEQTFSSVYQSLNRYHVIDYEKATTHEWVKFKNHSSNVYTSLRSYFIDFGLPGVIICQFIFGFIVSTIYYYIKKNKNSYLIILYSFFSYILIDQIRDEQFFNLISTATIAYIFLITALYLINVDNDIIKKLLGKIKTIFMKYFIKIKSSKFYKGLFKNSFWAFAGDSSASVINLVVTIVLIKLIGDDNLGVLVLTQTYMQIVDVILNVQAWKSVIQYGQKALVEKDKKKLLSYIKLGVRIDVITAIIGGVVAIFIAPTVGHIFNWSKEAILCAEIFSITIFSHLSGTSTALLRIFDKYHLVALQKFLTAVIKLASLLFLFLYFKKVSLLTATIVYCVTDIIGNIILVLFAIIEYKKKYKIIELIKSSTPKDSKSFISFTLWSTIGDITDIPVNYLDMFLISMLGTKMVAVFKVFKQCIAILKKVTSAIQQAIMPQFSELVASKKKVQAFNIVKKIRNVILKVMIPFGLIIGFTSPLWLKVLYGKLYANNWYILLIYLLVQIIALSYTALHPLYISLNKVKEDALIAFVSNTVYLVVSYLLVSRLGMLGIVIAFSIQSALIIYIKYNQVDKIILKEVSNEKNRK